MSPSLSISFGLNLVFITRFSAFGRVFWTVLELALSLSSFPGGCQHQMTWLSMNTLSLAAHSALRLFLHRPFDRIALHSTSFPRVHLALLLVLFYRYQFIHPDRSILTDWFHSRLCSPLCSLQGLFVSLPFAVDWVHGLFQVLKIRKLLYRSPAWPGGSPHCSIPSGHLLKL